MSEETKREARIANDEAAAEKERRDISSSEETMILCARMIFCAIMHLADEVRQLAEEVAIT